jgi:Virulence factor BrkB
MAELRRSTERQGDPQTRFSDMARRVQASVSEAVEPANQKYAPSCDEAQWRWISWSSTFAAISWLIVSFLFSYYTSHFGCYNKTYGSLGAVLDS